MSHRRPATTVLAPLALLLGWGVTGCGSGAESATAGSSEADATAAACEAGPDGDPTGPPVALEDDRGALPATVLLPVADRGDRGRRVVAAVDAVSARVSAADVASVAAAEGAARARAVGEGVADVPRADDAPRVRLVVPESGEGPAVAALYAAGLERRGARVTTTAALVPEAVGSVREGEADVAVVPIAALAVEVGVELPVGADPAEQAEVIAGAALTEELLVGEPSSTEDAPAVVVRAGLARGEGLSTLTDLAEACGTVTVGATAGTLDAAQALADTYGFEVVDGPVTDPAEALASGDSTVLAVVTTDPPR